MISDKVRYLILGIVLILVIASIVYLEKAKVAPSNIIQEDNSEKTKLENEILNKPLEIENIIADTNVELDKPMADVEKK